MSKLKPCPKCGCAMAAMEPSGDGVRFECVRCHWQGFEGNTKKQALQGWNEATPDLCSFLEDCGILGAER